VEPETDPSAELRLLVLTDEDTPVDFQLETPPLGLGPFRFEIFEDIPGLSYNPSQAAARYVPATNKNGVVHFAYRVTDANHLSALGGVEILVLPVNDPPVALPREIVVRSGSMTKLPIEGLDVDFDDLTVRIREEPVHGKLTPTAEGYFYLPNDDFIGEDELTYFVSDGESESQAVACRILVVPTAEISVPPSLETDISGKLTLRLKWKTVPGVRYVVVSNPDLDPRNWQRITEPQVASGTEESLVIPIPHGSESRWYTVEMPDFKL
ncbi:MAG: cadherin-like domain-containing protein, partial [Verrucomicrobiales bacterium]|nr:cadherin-like domain-containing protein [Verrucomicrobiales bacterium]